MSEQVPEIRSLPENTYRELKVRIIFTLTSQAGL